MLNGSIVACSIGRQRPTAVSTGGGGGSYPDRDAYYDAKYTAAKAALTFSSTVYISSSGSDSAPGNGSAAFPYQTLAKAFSVGGANMRVIVKAGSSYVAGNGGWLNDYAAGGNMSIPSGTGSNYTLIEAEIPGTVTVTQTSSLYYGCMIGLETAARIWVDGINLIHNLGSDVLFAWDFGTHHNRGTRLAFRRYQTDQFSASVRADLDSLLQHCCYYGAGRYSFFTGSGSADVVAGNSILRNVLVRQDWAEGDQPCAAIAHYGSDNASWVDSKNVYYQNVFVLDSPLIPNQASFGGTYAPFYHPKHGRNTRHQGCIALNTGAQYATFRSDNIGAATLFADDCAAFDTNLGISGFSPNAFQAAGSSVFTVNQCLAGLIPGSDFVGTSGNTNNRSSDTPGNILQRSGGLGANILYEYGEFLSHYGDTNYNDLSSDPLWPMPYESRWKAWIDTQISKPAGEFPASPTSSRQSFQGTSIDGSEMTVTRRFWEAAGVVTPSFATGAGVY